MSKSIKSSVTRYFLIFALLLSSLYLFSTSMIIKQTFDQYKSNNIESTNQSIIDHIEQNYNFNNGASRELVDYLALLSQQERMDITLYNENNNEVCSKNFNAGHMGHMMRGELMATTYPLTRNGRTVGYINIQQSRSSFMTQDDMLFMRNLRFSIMAVSVISFFIAIAIGLRISKKLTSPIIYLKDVAQEIKQGNLSLRVKDRSQVIEYEELSASINDMTETLEHQKNMRTTLANNISHELRTPLYVLKTHVEALSDGILEPTQDTFNSINAEINHLTHIVADIEQLTTLEDLIELKKKPIELTAFIQDFLKPYDIILKSESKNIIKMMERPVTIPCDGQRLRQVFTNLMSNALKFTSKGDTISIDLLEANGVVTIIFRDTGFGIDAEDLPYVFERFYRTAIKNNQHQNGAGLGLSIVKEIIDLHDGAISVTSEKDEYTEFTITLPVS